ncbi:MAG: F0F1 ATP synthase subunit alpha [Desulfovibrionales bacterium]
MSDKILERVLDQESELLSRALSRFHQDDRPDEIGRIRSISSDVAWAGGLHNVKYEELLLAGPSEIPGMAMEILPDRVGIILLGSGSGLRSGSEITRAGRVLDIPVGEGLVGRMVSPLGVPKDGKGPVRQEKRMSIHREAPPILDRSPVEVPVQTGLKVVDALFPIGRGQRELIVGDRQTGKTAMAVDALINQQGQDMICIYCAVGQRSSSVAKVMKELERYGALAYSFAVVVGAEESAGLQYIAPYAAMSMGEYFMEKGRDVLVVFDDLTRHARAYRQLSLLLRRPPGREAFPGDIFYIHSRLLERSTHLKDELGGGSLTALPIIETEAQNISAYIPTNLISITDGQLYFSPELFQKGHMPAIEVGLSVSRVGGKTQLPAYRRVSGDIRLSYTQYQELESFSRFGTRLEESTRKQLEHGRRVREILKQDQYDPMSAGEQILILIAVSKGYLDTVPIEHISNAEKTLLEKAHSRWDDLTAAVAHAEKTDPIWEEMENFLEQTVKEFTL